VYRANAQLQQMNRAGPMRIALHPPHSQQAIFVQAERSTEDGEAPRKHQPYAIHTPRKEQPHAASGITKFNNPIYTYIPHKNPNAASDDINNININ